MSWPPSAWVVLVAVLIGAAIFYAALPWIIQSIVRALLWPRYSFRVRGLEHVPRTGPLVLAANHLTWLDGFFLAAVVPRPGKALVNAAYLRLPILGALARRSGMVPVPAVGPRGQRAAITAVREALDQGEAVGIFPEAQVSRNGLTGSFYRGIEVIMAKREHIPVVPVFFDHLWGSLFSYSGGRFFWKGPQGFRRTVNVVFGPPVPPPITVFRLRQAMLEAGVRAFEMRKQPGPPLETLDPALPRWEHPTLGLLTASTADFHHGDVHHVGQKPGTVGHPVPGVAICAVNERGEPVGPDEEGHLQALRAGQPDWVDTGARGKVDNDGFVTLVTTAPDSAPVQPIPHSQNPA